ncbi:2-methyl-6-phytyl-1,4-hydroquinone methyltransferase [Streptomyces sp. MBT84]|uniref:class I SAM-dependent methyltransferase n=1 Tax=Streptomyces sp. MBT84 TaxID=1488414 RepID=UPI001C6E39AD|nr:class I SAM-dependent methyltransferase [Streptomyces sp. MBT84]MBW8706725.1 2-methyl-6-phytyl-1,4-hydroquinone methyltransferase [Streptomyces sp. MBT84]
MKILSPRVLRALEQFNAAYPWDHNAHCHRWILRQLPKRFERALDIGSGTGDLARLLGRRANKVIGVDSDPRIVAQAQHLTSPDAPVAFTVADAMTETPSGPFDVIACVATIHHLPFAQALMHFRSLLTPGGSLVVVGLSRADTRVDHLLGLMSVPLNPAMGWLKNKGRRCPRPLSMTAPTRAADMTFNDLSREAQDLLPGVQLRRRLFWRYTLVWHNQ